METTSRDELAKRHLAETEVDKTWQVPAYEGMGPVTLTLRLPEVKITDSEGRYIIISPRQSDLVSVRMAGISEWLRYGDEDFVDQTVPDDPEEPADQR
ncbi:MAG TPA: hypothetical protein VGP26_28895 [Actinophytocola sp.]|jgi:hypothetical protein|nr:hypothetical protein [Actinophytocola sp.]